MNVLEVVDINSFGDGRVILSGPLLWADTPSSLSDLKGALVGRKVAIDYRSGHSVEAVVDDAHLTQTMSHTWQASIGLRLATGVELAEKSIVRLI